jgi:hypothetical protein
MSLSSSSFPQNKPSQNKILKVLDPYIKIFAENLSEEYALVTSPDFSAEDAELMFVLWLCLRLESFSPTTKETCKNCDSAYKLQEKYLEESNYWRERANTEVASLRMAYSAVMKDIEDMRGNRRKRTVKSKGKRLVGRKNEKALLYMEI